MFTCVEQFDISRYMIGPRNIAVNRSRIFINDWGIHSVMIFGLDGAFIGFFDDYTCHHQTSEKFYIDDTSGQLFLPCLDCVHVFDLQGHYKRSIKTALYPRTVCCNNGGSKIFIGGGLYDPGWFAVYGGQSSNKINNHSGVQLGGWVSGITWNNIMREVFVSDHSNHRVVVFDEDGKFKRAFGKKGSSNGEFRYPGQLSVDEASGVLFITDMGNNRVQVVRCSDGSPICSINKLTVLKSIYYDSNSQCIYILTNKQVFIYKYQY